MKNIIPLIIIVFASTGLQAQEYKAAMVYPGYDYGKQDEQVGKYLKKTPIAKVAPISFKQYQIEDVSYFEVSHCIAGSDIAFYSGISGGRVLKTVTADNTGKIVVEETKNFSPAFALNLKNKNKAGIKGNGMVDFAEEKQFVIQGIKLQKNPADQNVLSWRAKVLFDNAVFDIQKSTDGYSFKTIGSLEVKKITDLSVYSFTDDIKNTDFYRLVLVDKNDKNSYLTKPVQLAGLSIVKLYPSPVTDRLNISLSPAVQKADYKIADNTGKVIRQGLITQKALTIAVTGLAKGVYFITIITKEKTETKKFIKN